MDYLCDMKFVSHHLTDLPKIIAEILPKIVHHVILFRGEMGAGNTTIIKEIISQLGSDDVVSSPTYALVNEYEIPDKKVYHFDFYRINHVAEAFDIGWEEYVDSGNLCLVEWTERIESLIPDNYHTLEIENRDNVRTISFK